MNVSIVSVSLMAGFLQIGQATLIHSLISDNGDLPLPVYLIPTGNLTGSSLFGTGTLPHFSQLMIGIGHPQ